MTRKGKGRICVDCTTRLDDNDDGAPNTLIPRPCTEDKEDENPCIYFASALKRHLEWIWNLRISHPKEDIQQYGDDIHAAFHRVLYHPDMAIVFAYVFMEFLVVPVGAIFGARNSPSYWCILSELRAHLTACRKQNSVLTSLAERVRLVAPPTSREQARLVGAQPDAVHQGISPIFRDRIHQAMYVDDSSTAAYRDSIRAAINASVESAYILLGSPGEDRRVSCLAEDKWRDMASYVMEHLGFEIDTRAMTIAWPVEKRLALKNLIAELWLTRDIVRRPREIAQLLGIIRNAGFVAPWGIYISIRLQQCLNDAIIATRQRCTKVWWYHGKVRIPDDALEDVRLIYDVLDDDPKNPTWRRYIGLMIRREPTSTIFSDASYEGLLGYSSDLSFMWRLSRQDLVSTGFDMKALCSGITEPTATATGLHINVLELVAIVINIWMTLRRLQAIGEIQGGHIVRVQADNTSALSWMKFAARSHSLPVRRLVRFLSALLLCTDFPCKMEGSHIKGSENVGADALSRLTPFPTWDSAISECSPLGVCQAYQIPCRLLFAISSIASSTKIEAQSELPMIELLRLELRTLRTGWHGMASTTSLLLR
ncbi:MAG: hypothetical protein ACREBR_03520 [bacterium]